ncbi:MAG: GntR family transcriptional regulator, partial [Terracidiphilus sp.]
MRQLRRSDCGTRMIIHPPNPIYSNGLSLRPDTIIRIPLLNESEGNGMSASAGANSSAPEAARSSDRVTACIRELILSGDLPPGGRISQEDLAARFSVSRIPVREALNRLESHGLVVLKPNSGAWVAKLDLAECIEVYKIRERIEPLALSESVQHIQDEEIARLEQMAVDM